MSTVTLDAAAIAGLSRPGGMIDENIERRAKRVLFTAQVRAPVVTGALRASGQARRLDFPPGAWQVVFLIYYAWFVDQGTVFMDPRYFLTYSLPEAVR